MTEEDLADIKARLDALEKKPNAADKGPQHSLYRAGLVAVSEIEQWQKDHAKHGDHTGREQAVEAPPTQDYEGQFPSNFECPQCGAKLCKVRTYKSGPPRAWCCVCGHDWATAANPPAEEPEKGGEG